MHNREEVEKLAVMLGQAAFSSLQAFIEQVETDEELMTKDIAVEVGFIAASYFSFVHKIRRWFNQDIGNLFINKRFRLLQKKYPGSMKFVRNKDAWTLTFLLNEVEYRWLVRYRPEQKQFIYEPSLTP